LAGCYLFTLSNSGLFFSYGLPVRWVVFPNFTFTFQSKGTFFILWRWTSTHDLDLQT